jgi:hypothetical protein
MKEKLHAHRIYKNKKELAAAKRGKGHDKSGTKGKRTGPYVVSCEIHGSKRLGDGEKTIIVQAVIGRRAKSAGCPLCRKGL